MGDGALAVTRAQAGPRASGAAWAASPDGSELRRGPQGGRHAESPATGKGKGLGIPKSRAHRRHTAVRLQL